MRRIVTYYQAALRQLGMGRKKRLPGEKETGEIWMGRCGEYRFGSAGIMIILRILICSIPLGRQGNGQETLFR